MQVRARDVGPVGRPHHRTPRSAIRRRAAARSGSLEYRHVAAVATAPLQIPACGSARLDWRHHLHEGVASREHRIRTGRTAPPPDRRTAAPSRMPSAVRAATRPQSLRHQGDLAQAGSGEHTSTVDDPPRSGWKQSSPLAPNLRLSHRVGYVTAGVPQQPDESVLALRQGSQLAGPAGQSQRELHPQLRHRRPPGSRPGSRRRTHGQRPLPGGERRGDSTWRGAALPPAQLRPSFWIVSAVPTAQRL